VEKILSDKKIVLPLQSFSIKPKGNKERQKVLVIGKKLPLTQKVH
jgi:hypothetical protein